MGPLNAEQAAARHTMMEGTERLTRLARQMGATLTVQSAAGWGSVFQLRLPPLRPEPASAAAA